MRSALAPPPEQEAAAAPPAAHRADRPAPRSRWAWTALAAGLALWLGGLPSVAGAPISQWGLLAAASPLLGAGIAATVVGFVLAVRAGSYRAAVSATFLMAAQLRLTVTLGTAVPFYSWAYKHLAVVDYLTVHGHVDRSVDIYQNWPGLFAATAWFSEATGLSPLTIAHWFTPVAHVFMIVLSLAMARAWGIPKLGSAVVAFVIETVNWVAQDYYSPQAVTFIIALAVITLIGHARNSQRATVLLIGLFAAITITHQLTPYWLILACFLLTIRRQLRPWWLVFVLAAIAGAFLLLNYGSVRHYGLLSFNPVENAQSNIPTVGVLGQQVTSAFVRALAVVVWLGAAIAAVHQRRRADAAALPLVLLAFSSFLLLAGQGYGGEAIFRVFLYSLPGVAMLLARPLTALLRARARAWVPTSIVVAGATFAATLGYFGPWSAYRMTKEEVRISTRLLDDAHFPAYLTPAALVWPERNSARYARFAKWKPDFDQTMVEYANLLGSHFATEADYEKFMTAAAARKGGPTYLIITQQMIVYGWYFGGLPIDALPNLERRMQADPRWHVYYRSHSVVIFESTGTP